MKMVDFESCLILLCLSPAIGLFSSMAAVVISEAVSYAARRFRKARRRWRNKRKEK